MKTCTKCGNSFDEENFAFKNKTLGKRNSQCNECRREGNRKSYYNHHEKNLEKVKQYKVNNKSWYQDLKKSLSCCVCGENEPSCLDFHHLDETKKDFSVGKRTKGSIKKLKEEINKCACLCANCHRKHHAGKLNASLVKLDIT